MIPFSKQNLINYEEGKKREKIHIGQKVPKKVFDEAVIEAISNSKYNKIDKRILKNIDFDSKSIPSYLEQYHAMLPK
jgi:hypothetical protein